MAHVWAGKHVLSEAGGAPFLASFARKPALDGHSYTPPEIYSIV